MALFAVWMTAVSAASDRVAVEGGAFTPLYGTQISGEPVRVDSFIIDRFPVTNGEFKKFLDENPEWRVANVPAVLSDRNYLKHWIGGPQGAAPPTAQLSKPVVHVSWFAANDFCAWRGGRLLTVLEWEYAAAASSDTKDASRDPAFVQRLLEWYAKPSGGTDNLPDVGQGEPNVWGIHDLHGVVWEWTADFNSVFVLGDNRRDGEALNELFCGAGAASGADKANYAAFMRYALRSSLRGQYTTANLGFRCAYDKKAAAQSERKK